MKSITTFFLMFIGTTCMMLVIFFIGYKTGMNYDAQQRPAIIQPVVAPVKRESPYENLTPRECFIRLNCQVESITNMLALLDVQLEMPLETANLGQPGIGAGGDSLGVAMMKNIRNISRLTDLVIKLRCQQMRTDELAK